MIARVWIRQWICDDHGAFREYPPFLLRYKHYVAEVVDAALDSRSAGVTVEAFCAAWDLPDVRTPTRWIAGFVHRLKSVGLATERRLRALQPQSPRSPASHHRWHYAYVWDLLFRLQAVCQATLQPISRSHFVFGT